MPENSESVAPFRVLLAVAAPAECRAVLEGLGHGGGGVADWVIIDAAPGVDVVRTGVGKAAAAGGVARVLDARRHAAVVNVGIAGALAGGPPLRAKVLATSSLFADEGLATPDGFTSLAAMGFSPFGAGLGAATDAALRRRLLPWADVEGVIATVSTCSGHDDLAAAVQARTGAIAEAMEGAAAGLAAHRLGVPFAEFRVISNTTGNRGRQAWDLAGSLGVLREVIGRVARTALATP